MFSEKIIFTEANYTWLIEQIKTQKGNSINELVNELIRRARKQPTVDDFIRVKLIQAENSGFTNFNKFEILEEPMERLHLRNDK